MNRQRMTARFAGMMAVILALFLAGVGVAHAIDNAKTLSIGSASGALNSTVSLPLTVNDISGVGGVAFTITYNPVVFQWAGLVVAEKAISDGSACSDGGNPPVYNQCDQNTIANTMFFQANERKVGDTPIGKVLVAAASANVLTNGALFNARFTIKGGQGAYPIDLTKTIIQNAQAGYAAPTFLPVLVGMPAVEPVNGYYPTPIFETTLVGGSITVTGATSYTVSGTVTYQGGGVAAGVRVALLGKLGSSYTVPKGQTTTSNTGTFSFANVANGDYRVAATSNNPNYYNKSLDVTVNGGNNTTADIILPAPASITGHVFIGGEGSTTVIPGLKVKVTNADGSLVIGVYPVSNDGSYQSAPLPPGTYHVYAVYGSLTSQELTANGSSYWNPTLRTITGTVQGLAAGDTVTITAATTTGKLLKSVTSNVADQAGDATYSIPSLVPADDYIVSAVKTGVPVQYYNGKTDILQATKVDVSAIDAGGIDFSYANVATGTITGTVSDNGTGVSAIRVFGFNPTTYSLVSALTNESGVYSLTVTPGSYQVFVIKNNNRVFFYSAAGTTQNPASATAVPVVPNANVAGINISLTECTETLTGKVTYERADGAPVAFALISAASDGKRAMTITGQDGGYSLAGLCTGTSYTVRMDPLAGNYGAQTKSITAGTDTTLDFIVNTGNDLSGTVTESVNGNPVAGATIFLLDQVTGTMVGNRMYFSGNDGTYLISDIKDGVYTLVVAHSLYKTSTATNLIITADMVQDIVLTQGANFFGQVTDSSDSTPLAGAMVVAARPGVTPVYKPTNASGNYRLYGMDASKSDYLVGAEKQGYVRSIQTGLTPAEGAGTQVDFPLSSANSFDLTGRISDCNDDPVNGALVAISSATKMFIGSATTAADGTYTIRNVTRAADYRFMVVPGGNLQTYVETGVDLTGIDTHPAIIPCGTTISGTVTRSGSSPIYLFLYTAAGAFVDYTTADPSTGAYTFNGLVDSHQYKVLAASNGNIPEWYDNQDSLTNATAVNAGDTVDMDLTVMP